MAGNDTIVKNILDEIVEHKRREVAKLPACEFFMHELKHAPEPREFIKALEKASGPAIIAESKKASPSKGLLKENYDALEIAQAYETGGAHCLSILTDKQFFQGDIKDLQKVSSKVSIPCLRKDFIIDKRQIPFSRLAGADAILLIAAILDDVELKRYRQIANDLGMDVLVEVHDEAEMERALNSSAKLIGINNRDLKSFEVSLETTSNLIDKFKSDLSDKVLVSESGIHSHDDITQLYNLGVKAFLVGESLITQANQTQAVRQLLQY